jgi:hypothetical protein
VTRASNIIEYSGLVGWLLSNLKDFRGRGGGSARFLPLNSFGQDMIQGSSYPKKGARLRAHTKKDHDAGPNNSIIALPLLNLSRPSL